MMSTVTYYKLSLGMPILLPPIVAGLTHLVGGEQGVLGFISFILTWSLALGGIPYLYTAIRLLVILSDRTKPVNCEELAWSAPLRMLPAGVVYWVVCALLWGIIEIAKHFSLPFSGVPDLLHSILEFVVTVNLFLPLCGDIRL